MGTENDELHRDVGGSIWTARIAFQPDQASREAYQSFSGFGDGSNVDVINLRGIIRSAFLSLPWGIEAFHSDACDYFNAVRAAYTDQRRHKRAILYQDIDYPEEQANFIHHNEH